MARKQEKKMIPQQDGFLSVPTYLFPQANEYGKDVMPEMDLEDESEAYLEESSQDEE